MNERKYPLSLFLMGFVTNVLFRFFWLSIPGALFLIVGIFIKPCIDIGLILFIIDVFLSFIDQFRIRNTFLQESSHPGFREFQDALSKDGDWRKNLMELMDEKIDNDRH